MSLQKIIKPARLRKGDAVGIVSPSSSIAHFPRRTARGIEALEALGLKVVVGKNAKNTFGHSAGTAQERADDIHAMFLDPSIKAIICSTGGYNANAVLPLLDYDLIKKNPKIFCGYSDITALNLAIAHKTGLVTFNGPTLLPTFGEFDGPFDFTVRNFKKLFFESAPLGELESATDFSEENLWWERDDIRRSLTNVATPPYIVSAGLAEGRLLGGNLNTLCILGGTEFFPDFTDAILFLEDMGEDTASTERHLCYLEQLGVFSKIRGLIYGRPQQFSTVSPERTLYDILGDFAQKYNILVLADIDCGHTNPLLTLPLGVSVTLDATQKKVIITESAVL